MNSSILELAQSLMRCRSITPDDAGCQQIVAARLRAVGFQTEPLRFGAVDNLLAMRGEGPLRLLFLGHTDVVPPGPCEAWRSDPFEPVIRDGVLYGRGAADMKGAVAAMVVALERLAASDAQGVGLLLTSDEEGDARDGVQRVAEVLRQRGWIPHYCVVGEPSSAQKLCDVIRIGRRGSLHGHLRVQGVQGHVAYPELANNPIHAAAPALAELAARRWDEGNAYFPPTSFQISNLTSGTGATNVIPGTLEARFNFRFGTASTAGGLQSAVKSVLDRHQLDYTVDWELSGAPFLTQGGRLLTAARSAIEHVCGYTPRPDTGGGTSDGRFIAPLSTEVVEVGVINASIHKANEQVAVADLERLARIYELIGVSLAIGDKRAGALPLPGKR